MDGGDVYTAGLNNYDLSPIIVEDYGEQSMFTADFMIQADMWIFSVLTLFVFYFHTFSSRHLLLRSGRGQEGNSVWDQRPRRKEILSHWFGEICRLEHSHWEAGVHGYYSVGWSRRQTSGGG